MYKDQPLFSDIDIFVREKLGLELWDIRKTYWKYKQKKYRSPVKGRLIFGDALYLRPLSTLDNWLSSMNKDMATRKFHALINTTIAYGYFDYASALLNTDFSNNYLDKECKKSFIRCIDNTSRGIYFFKNGNRLLHGIFYALMHSFRPTHQGWAISESNIGSRKRMFFWN